MLSSEKFNTILQEVKTALFNRDFDKAFGNEEYLETYAARWSPTRALCYASVLAGIETYLAKCTTTTVVNHKPIEQVEPVDKEHSPDVHDAAKHDETVGVTNNNNTTTTTTKTLKVLAIGGAAAEVIALASFLSQQNNQQEANDHTTGEVTLLDIAPWAHVIEKLRVQLTTPSTLSKYASAAAQAANTALVRPEQLQNVTFQQKDVLALSKQDLKSLLCTGPQQQPQKQSVVVVTLLFTLNELFNTAGGIGKTTAFLLNLTAILPSGSLLLVIDSPGSYSETTVGKEAKRRYPMQWLLDKILLEGTDDGAEEWEKVESADSVWFRLGPELRYPIPLEDMRYQMHLYRRGGDVVD